MHPHYYITNKKKKKFNPIFDIKNRTIQYNKQTDTLYTKACISTSLETNKNSEQNKSQNLWENQLITVLMSL